jgi:hypothetical protein
MRDLTPLLAAGLLAIAGPASAHHAPRHLDDAIWVGHHGTFTNWRPVARDELVVWASPSRAYLVKIWRPFTSLRFVDTVGVTRTAGRVTALDRVIVAGQSLPIKSIARLQPELAREMRWRS